MDIYRRLGLEPVINAAGTLTRLGGTNMLPEARDAMSEAANAMVPVDELQAVASKVIARICGSEAGYVASGAAAGLTLATAACMVGLDVVKMDQLPFPKNCKNEVIISRPHRNSYDHAYRAAGAVLVEVGMSDRHVGCGVRETEVWEYEAAITENTAAIAYTQNANPYPPLKAITAMAKKHGIPVIVDAASQLPPPSNLRRFIEEGADIVSFSGGKAIRGPQGTGVIAGRKDLIASIALQQLDMDVTFELWNPPADLIPKERLAGAPRHGVGRGYKVSKEQIVGLIVALGLFTEERCRQDYAFWLHLLEQFEQGLKGISHITTSFMPPRVELGHPQLEVKINEPALGKSAYDIASELRSGNPPVYVGERRVMDGSILLHPANLDEQSAQIALQRLKQVLK